MNWHGARLLFNLQAAPTELNSSFIRFYKQVAPTELNLVPSLGRGVLGGVVAGRGLFNIIPPCTLPGIARAAAFTHPDYASLVGLSSPAAERGHGRFIALPLVEGWKGPVIHRIFFPFNNIYLINMVTLCYYRAFLTNRLAAAGKMQDARAGI